VQTGGTSSVPVVTEQVITRGNGTRNATVVGSEPSFVPATSIPGTVTVTNGSATVTGSGTAFRSGGIPLVGQPVTFAVDGTNTRYIVKFVNSDTSITLASNYTGVGGSGTAMTMLGQSFQQNKVAPFVIGGGGPGQT